MARDKRGQGEEPGIEEALTDMEPADGADFIAGPTSRNEAGDVRRAAAKAAGVMGASRKVDPDLAVDPDAGRPKSGSKAGLHGFSPVADGESGEVVARISNADIVDDAKVAARKSPAPRPARDEP